MAKDLPSLDSKDNKSTAYHLKNEAISALIALGFGRPQIEQVFKNIPELSDPSTPIEDLIKIALKNWLKCFILNTFYENYALYTAALL